MELSKLIGFNPKIGNYVLGTHGLDGKERNDLTASDAQYWTKELNALLRSFGSLSREDHRVLAQTIVEPIEKIIPYAEMYDVFYQSQTYGPLEDNAIPVEDILAIAWETHEDGAIRPVRSGFSWTRPGFVRYDTAMEVGWYQAEKTGWNFLARQMRRATESLARKRDERALNTYVAALLASHVVTVSGGALTKASIDTIVRGAADIGFPVLRAILNPGTLKDFADFTWPAGNQLPPDRQEQLITNQYLTNYAGVDWYANANAPTNRVRFSGTPNQIGWHQIRGGVRNVSDMDIFNKRDVYAILDAEHAWYIGNELSLWEIRITA